MELIKKESMILLSKGRTEEAINALLKTVSSDSNAYKYLIQIKWRYEELKQHELRGTLSFDFVSLERNKIANSLLEVVDMLNQEDFEKNINARVTLKPNNEKGLIAWIKRLIKKIFG